jgi:hypothetical protein
VSCASLVLERIAGVSTTTEAKRTARIIDDDDCRAEGKGRKEKKHPSSIHPTIRMQNSRREFPAKLQLPSPTSIMCSATLA